MRVPLIERIAGQQIASQLSYATTRKVRPGELWLIREIAVWNPSANTWAVAGNIVQSDGTYLQLDNGSVAGSNGLSLPHYLLLREGEACAAGVYSTSGPSPFTAIFSGWIFTEDAEELVVVAPTP